MKQPYHFVARSLHSLKPFQSRDESAGMWKKLRSKFPDIAACVLMPNHLHLLAYSSEPKRDLSSLRSVLSSWTQKYRPRKAIWERVPDAKIIPNGDHLVRNIRYVHLNPCRARLVQDPLSWEWSTHRDFTGCVTSPWPDLTVAAKTFQVSLGNLGVSVHRYVSSDPTVSVSGTPMVKNFKQGDPIQANCNYLVAASAIALRENIVLGTRGSVRTLAAQTAHHLNLKYKAEDFGLSPSGLYMLLKKSPDLTAIDAVLRIIVDPRCRPAAVSNLDLGQFY